MKLVPPPERRMSMPKNVNTGSLPDFIIGGAMKSATSSLHNLLATHNRVFIPDDEIHFFSIDDFIQHPPYFFGAVERRMDQDYRRDFERNLRWYESFFEPANDGQLIGEDSTAYLASPKAPGRIRELLPDVKLIFMLRNPVDRTYSHYWHRVRKGKAVNDFEHEIRYGPNNLHRRSFYKPQLNRYLDTFPRAQVKVILFEEFVEETQRVVNDACSFLGLQTTVSVEEASQHRNPSRVPYFFRLQLWMNRIIRDLDDFYERLLPGIRPTSLGFWNQVQRSVFSRLQRWNLKEGSYPPMKEETRAHLSKIYGRENRGLGEIVGIDFQDYWPCMREEVTSEAQKQIL